MKAFSCSARKHKFQNVTEWGDITQRCTLEITNIN
jgi:hypothetical protein